MNCQNAKMRIYMVAVLFVACVATARAEEGVFPGKKVKWHKYVMYKDKGNRVVVPEKAAEGKPWIWRARFFGHEPQFDLKMLDKGYHVVYCEVGGLYGAPEAVERWTPNEGLRPFAAIHGREYEIDAGRVSGGRSTR